MTKYLFYFTFMESHKYNRMKYTRIILSSAEIVREILFVIDFNKFSINKSFIYKFFI